MPSLFLHSLTHPSHSFTLTISLSVFPHSISLSQSLRHSLSTQSLKTLPPCLNHSHTPSLPHSLPPCLIHSHTPSITPTLSALPASITQTIPPCSVTHTLPPCLNHSHTLFPSCLISVAEPPLFWAAPAPGGQGPGADSGSDLLGSAPAPR